MFHIPHGPPAIIQDVGLALPNLGSLELSKPPARTGAPWSYGEPIRDTVKEMVKKWWFYGYSMEKWWFLWWFYGKMVVLW